MHEQVGVTAVFAITIVNFMLIIVALIRPTPNFGSGLFSISTVRSASLTSRSLPAEEPPIAEVPPLRGRRIDAERNSRTAHVVARAEQYWITIDPYTQCHEEAEWTLCVGWDDLKASWVPLGTTVVGYTRTTTVQNKNGDAAMRTFVSLLSADAGKDMPGFSMHKPSDDDGEAAVRTVADAAGVDGSEVPATLRTLTRTRGKQDDVPTSKARTKTKKTKQTAKMTGNDGGSTRTRWTTTTMSTTSKTTLRPGETGIGSSKTTSKPNSPSNGSKGNSTAVAFEGLWVSRRILLGSRAHSAIYRSAHSVHASRPGTIRGTAPRHRCAYNAHVLTIADQHSTGCLTTGRYTISLASTHDCCVMCRRARTARRY